MKARCCRTLHEGGRGRNFRLTLTPYWVKMWQRQRERRMYEEATKEQGAENRAPLSRPRKVLVGVLLLLVFTVFFVCGVVYGGGLYHAAEHGRAGRLAFILGFPGIDVNKHNAAGHTALHLAVWHGQAECVARLLACPGIDVNMADQDGKRPLCTAVAQGNEALVAMLLAAEGINPNVQDAEGKTPLYVATVAEDARLMRMLLAAGADAAAQNADGSTAWEWAAAHFHAGRCALLRAALPGMPVEEARKQLSEQGVAPAQYQEALCNAAYRGDTGLLELLLAAGADVNAGAVPPLTLAVMQGHTDCVKLLVTTPGIDVNARANRMGGDTPLQCALSLGNAEVAAILRTCPGIQEPR